MCAGSSATTRCARRWSCGDSRRSGSRLVHARRRSAHFLQAAAPVQIVAEVTQKSATPPRRASPVQDEDWSDFEPTEDHPPVAAAQPAPSAANISNHGASDKRDLDPVPRFNAAVEQPSSAAPMPSRPAGDASKAKALKLGTKRAEPAQPTQPDAAPTATQPNSAASSALKQEEPAPASEPDLFADMEPEVKGRSKAPQPAVKPAPKPPLPPKEDPTPTPTPAPRPALVLAPAAADDDDAGGWGGADDDIELDETADAPRHVEPHRNGIKQDPADGAISASVEPPAAADPTEAGDWGEDLDADIAIGHTILSLPAPAEKQQPVEDATATAWTQGGDDWAEDDWE